MLDALRYLSSPRALVIRDGRRQRIADGNVVQGDVIILSEGNRVLADVRLLSVGPDLSGFPARHLEAPDRCS